MDDGPRETSGVTTRLIVDHVRHEAGEAGVTELVRRAGRGRTLAELEDETRWTTYDHKLALFAAAAEICDDRQVARHVGQRVLNARIGAGTRTLLWALGSPQRVYREVVRIAPKFSTAADLGCASASGTSAVVTYRLRDGHRPDRHDCEYNVGLLSAVPGLFGLPPARVEHLRCQVRGDDECRYRVTWRRRRRFRRPAGDGWLHEELREHARHVLDLQDAATELTSQGSVDDALDRAVRRASLAVRARAFVVAVQPRWGESPTVRAVGVEPDEATIIGEEALAGIRPADWLVAPMATGARRYGVIVALQAVGYRFFDDEQGRLDAYAALAAAAVEAAAEREATAALLRLAADIAAARTVQAATDRALEVVVALTGASEAAVAVDPPSPAGVRVLSVHGVGATVEALLRPARDPAADPMPGRDVALLAADELPPGRLREVLTAAGARAVALARVRWRDDMLGWVATAWTGPAPTALDPALAARLTGVAGLLAPTVVTAHALEDSTHRALHDPLTDLPNRVLLADRYALASARARRHGTALVVVLIDLDGFKALNDRHGHRAGDRALVTVADRLRAIVRDADTAARLGGDEFVVLTEATPGGSEAATLARRIERALEPPMDLDGIEATLTASAGAAVVEPTADLDDALSRADERMFERKRERRGDPVHDDAPGTR